MQSYYLYGDIFEHITYGRYESYWFNTELLNHINDPPEYDSCLVPFNAVHIIAGEDESMFEYIDPRTGWGVRIDLSEYCDVNAPR